MGLLQVVNVSKSFKSRLAVNDVSFSIKEGELFGLLGPNGAGKSTALSLISGLLKIDSGKITVGDWDVSKHPLKARALIGVVPQEPALYPQLSAVANLRFWGTINGLTGLQLDSAVDKSLKTVDLTDRANDKMSKYSGGMKRRLNIAAGLIHNPKLLIMDEPTVGVDPQSRNHILTTIKELKAQGTTIIYTSHYVEEVEQLCDRVAIMDRGKIISIGQIAELQKEAGEFQELIITLQTSNELPINVVQGLAGVHEAFLQSNTLRVLTSNAEQALPIIFETLVSQGLSVSEIKILKPNLESLFLKLTGRALRD